LRVTVAVEFAVPPITLVGLSDTEVTAGGGSTVRTPVCVLPLSAAEILTFVGAATVSVVTANVAVVEPAATVTVAGTVATPVLLLVSVTVR
jgi:hypothetical protein